MPMTRELKKRFTGIEDSLEKVEKKKGTMSEPSSFEGSGLFTRLDLIEKVLMMPGPKRKKGQVLSGYAEIVDQLFTQLKERTEKIEMVLQIPGETRGDTEILSAWREFIESQIRELKEKWDPLFNVGNWIDKTDERFQKLEQIPDPSDWMQDVKSRLYALERKPVAGTLSNITQGVTEDIEGINREVLEITKSVKTLRFKVRLVTWMSLLLFAMILLTQYLV